MSSIGTFISKVILIVALILVGAGALVFLPPKIGQRHRLEAQRQQLQTRIQQTQRDIERLKHKQQRFSSDPKFVEFIARQNRRIAPNELLFMIETPDSDR